MKTTTCAFCGQELKKGMLGIGGNKKELYLGFTTLDCCPHCYQKYEHFVQKDNYRFRSKMENAFYTPGKISKLEKQLSREEIVSYFLHYYEESDSYAWDRDFNHYFPVSVDGSLLSFYMTPNEVSYYAPIDTIALTVQLEDECQQILLSKMLCQDYISSNHWPFDSDDISCLEYSYEKQKTDEDYLLIHLRVKLNDPRQITYRPCIISGAVIYPTSLRNQDSYIDQHIMMFMLKLRTALQVENIPIIKREAIELHSGGQAPAVKNPPKPTFMDKPIVQKVTGFLEDLADKFHTLRIICCFLPVLSSIGFCLTLSDTTNPAYALGGIFMMVGCASALLACPTRFIEIIVGLVGAGLYIGLFFALVGSIIGGGIGLALGIALFIYAPAFVTIPYYFKELRQGV